MIVDFSMENFGPFKDRVTLSFLCATMGQVPENVLDTDAIQGGLLNTTAIFGPNASGKSFVITAISALQAMVSSPLQAKYRYPWYLPFSLSKDTLDTPVSLEIRLIVDGVLQCYSISYDEDSVISESLSIYPEGRKNIVFSREGDQYKFGRSMAKGQKMISQMTSSSSSYLSVASRFNNQLCRKVQQAITEDIMVVPHNRDERMHDAVAMMFHDPKVKEMVIKALEITDFGISDLELDTDSDMDMMASSLRAWTSDHPIEDVRIWAHHGQTEATDGREPRISIGMESNGTIEFIGLMAPVARALLSGGFVLADEFSSYLHPMVSRWLLSQFSNECNPNGAQLLIATNDHTLMDAENIFRRDQIYFTHKDSFTGSTELYSLFDYDEEWSPSGNIGGQGSLFQPLPYISHQRLLPQL